MVAWQQTGQFRIFNRPYVTSVHRFAASRAVRLGKGKQGMELVATSERARNRTSTGRPGICVISPARGRHAQFRQEFKTILSETAIASIRLETSGASGLEILDTTSFLKDLVGELATSLLLENRIELVDILGLDGVHLVGGPRMVGTARKTLGGEFTVGASCGSSMHWAMNAGEAGADYVSFGPISASERGGDKCVTGTDLFDRWRDMTALPVVAEGCLTPHDAAKFRSSTDFLAIGSSIWDSDDPVRSILELIRRFNTISD